MFNIEGCSARANAPLLHVYTSFNHNLRFHKHTPTSIARNKIKTKRHLIRKLYDIPFAWIDWPTDRSVVNRSIPGTTNTQPQRSFSSASPGDNYSKNEFIALLKTMLLLYHFTTEWLNVFGCMYSDVRDGYHRLGKRWQRRRSQWLMRNFCLAKHHLPDRWQSNDKIVTSTMENNNNNPCRSGKSKQQTYLPPAKPSKQSFWRHPNTVSIRIAGGSK